MRCRICKTKLDDYTAYEYRGDFSCEEHFDEMCELRDYERNQIIQEDNNKTKYFKGLDLSDSVIGKANKRLLKTKIEITSKESVRLNIYERGGDSE